MLKEYHLKPHEILDMTSAQLNLILAEADPSEQAKRELAESERIERAVKRLEAQKQMEQ